MSTDFHFSKSALNDFIKCPESFKYKYVMKLPDGAGPEARRGRHIHEVFEDFFKTLKVEDIKDEQHILDYLMAYDNGSLTQHLQSFAALQIQRYKQLKDKSLFKPIFAEDKLYHEKHNLSGIVDALYKDDKGDVLLLDYKSSKYNPKYTEDYRFELAIYRELLLYKTEFKPTKWGIFYTRGGYLWQEPVDPMYFQEKVIPVLLQAKRAVERNEFPPRVNPLCLYCNQKSICSAFGGKK